MAKIEYTPLNLPKALVEELKIWRMAFNNAYGKTVSYGEMLRGMLDSLEQTEPGVVDELNSIMEKHPDLMEKMANYRNLCGEEANGDESDKPGTDKKDLFA